MRKLLKHIVNSIVLSLMVFQVFGQISDFSSISNHSVIGAVVNGTPASPPTRSVGMVIGPKLHDQMGANSNYYLLSMVYNNPDLFDKESYGADDFIVPAGKTWNVKYVRTTMFFSGAITEVAGMTVAFYADNSGKPGTELDKQYEITDLVWESGPLGYGYVADITVVLPTTVTLTEGKYWVSIEAVNNNAEANTYGNPTFYGGYILQDNLTSTINSEWHWRNPEGGYDVDFMNWTSASTYFNKNAMPNYKNLNFAVFGEALNNDLEARKLISPTDNSDFTTEEQVVVLIANNGKVDQSGYQIRYRLNGGSWVTENGPTIVSGTQTEYAFHTGVDVSAAITHLIEVEIVSATEENPTDNTLSTSVRSYGKLLKAYPDSLIVYETCSGTFTDHGGLSDVYVSYSDDTVVLKPATPGSRIRLEFEDTDMSGAYAFRFFNGSNTDAPHIGNWESLNGSTGIYTQEIPGLVVEGTNPEGAVTIIIPGFDANASKNNVLGNVTCVVNEPVDFKVMELNTSKDLSWAGEEIELTATLMNRGSITRDQLVTFFANDVALATVSSTVMSFGEIGTAKIKFTPPSEGIYSLKAQVPADNGTYANDKYFELEKEFYRQGMLVEGFEGEQYPPEAWTQKVVGGSSRSFIWYNSRPSFQGKYNLGFGNDTIVTPLLDINSGDKIELIFYAHVFGATCNVLYSSSLNGPWRKITALDAAANTVKTYSVDLTAAAGVNYVAFAIKGNGAFDMVKGPRWKLYNNDIKAISLKGSMDPLQNVASEYSFEVRNLGTAALADGDYSVKLYKKVAGVETEIASIAGTQIGFSNYKTFVFNPVFTQAENCQVYARIEYATDGEPRNNTSNTLSVAVQKAGTEYVYIGDETSTKSEQGALAGYYGNYAEQIITKDEIGRAGEIHGLSIYYSQSMPFEFDGELYIGETTSDNLSEGFLSTSVLDKVDDFTITVVPVTSGHQQYIIQFDKPYLYDGEKNLVIAWHRFNTGDFGGSLLLQGSLNSNNQFRAHGFQFYEKDTDISNPEELNALPTYNPEYQPNVKLYIKTTEMDASLSGTVYNDEGTEKLEDVTISINGFANTTTTDVNGAYAFNVMPYGNIDITATKYAYFDTTRTGVFTAATNTVIDFNMPRLPLVTVSGLVVATDANQPVEGVTVNLTGYDLDVVAYTAVDGTFTLSNIYAKKDYLLTLSHYKYETWADSIFVGIQGLTIDTIKIDEIEQPAFNVIATETGNGTNQVDWKAPFTGIESEFKPMGENEITTFWYNEPDEDVQMGNLFKVTSPGTVTSIQIAPWSWEGAQEGNLYLKVYNKDRELILDSKPFIMPVEYVDWFTVDVPDFSYTEDFYVFIHWDRLHQQTPGLAYHKDLENNVSYIIDKDGKWSLLSDFVSNENHKGAFSIKANTLVEAGTATRVLTNYDLYRSTLDNSQNEANWTKLNESPVETVNGVGTFTDTSFVSAANGHYVYVLKTNYTLATSEPVYSNTISKGMNVAVTINVTANNDADITGAQVSMISQTNPAIAPFYSLLENGKVEFVRVPKGNYKISVVKGAAYHQYTSIESVNADKTFNIELRERIYTPEMLNVDVQQQDSIAIFTWGLGEVKQLKLDADNFTQALGIQPGNTAGLGNLFETVESGQVFSVDVLGIETSGNQNGKVTVAIYDVASEKLLGQSEPFELPSNEWITVDVPLANFTGSFYAMVMWSEDEANETNALAVDETLNPGYTTYYDESQGFASLGAMGYWGTFGIRANVLVSGKKSAVLAASKKATKTGVQPTIIKQQEVQMLTIKDSRAVTNYNIYLDDKLVSNNVVDMQFTFTNSHMQVKGIHTYEAGVEAVYTTGTSAFVSTSFVYEKAIPNGVDENVGLSQNIYPNPAQNQVTILNTEQGVIDIYNLLGVKVKTLTATGNETMVDISDLSNGSYLVKVKQSSSHTLYRLVINK